MNIEVVEMRNCSLNEKERETASFGLGDWITRRRVSRRRKRLAGEVNREMECSSRKIRRCCFRWREKSFRRREESARSTSGGPA